MDWWQFSLLGAGGGAVVEILAVFHAMTSWQTARRTSTGRIRSSPPPLREFLDLPAHAWIFPIRALLGAGGAALFGVNGQITGVVAAVALGYAAPSVLAQLGAVPQVQAFIAGTTADSALPTAKESRLAAPAGAERGGTTSGR